MKIQKHVLLIWLVWSVVQIAGAESLHKLTSYKRYIHEYKSLAIEQQHKYKIPASITLAQGLLESGAGQTITSASNATTGKGSVFITTTTVVASVSANTAT